MSKIKIERLQSQIQKEIALILKNKIKNEICKTLIITDVELTNDLSYATIFYSTLDSKKIQDLEKNIEKTKGEIRRQLSMKLSIYKTPQLIFKYDQTLQAAERINEILNKINEVQK